MMNAPATLRAPAAPPRDASTAATLHTEDRALVTVSNLLSPTLCAEQIRWAEAQGFEQAPIGGGDAIRLDVRDNDRVMHDDPERAAWLWGILAPWVPERWGRFRAVGLNERFRYYRYTEGQYFHWHYDGSFWRKNGERSLFTALVYLNDDFDGGTTDFQLGLPVFGASRRGGPPREVLRIAPRRGSALLFEHRQLHRGAEVERGVKYVLRTDVMYVEE